MWVLIYRMHRRNQRWENLQPWRAGLKQNKGFIHGFTWSKGIPPSLPEEKILPPLTYDHFVDIIPARTINHRPGYYASNTGHWGLLWGRRDSWRCPSWSDCSLWYRVTPRVDPEAPPDAASRHMVHFNVELISSCRSLCLTSWLHCCPISTCISPTWPPWYHLQKVWLCRWLGHPNRPPGIEEDWKHPKPGHEHLGPSPAEHDFTDLHPWLQSLELPWPYTTPEAVAAKSEWQ